MNLYDINVLDNNNQLQSLSTYQNQVLLIVNTATECEFTEQYDELEDLFEQYHDQGFWILDFPCNQFGEQAPGTMEEIISFCADTYGVSFPQFAKIDVNGPNEAPIYTYLKENQDPALSKRIDWNFTKFLIGANGQPLERFESNCYPMNFEQKIVDVLTSH